MDFLHQSNIIHRDLKPQNILVVSLEPGSATVAKITDFGTVRDFVTVRSTKRMTLRSKAECCAPDAADAGPRDSMTRGVGTTAYMAPEILNASKYDKPADVYSFSMVIYFLCTNLEPFSDVPAMSSWQFIRRVAEGARPTIPKTVPPECSQLLDIMIHCWNQDPSQRPSLSSPVFLNGFSLILFLTAVVLVCSIQGAQRPVPEHAPSSRDTNRAADTAARPQHTNTPDRAHLGRCCGSEPPCPRPPHRQQAVLVDVAAPVCPCEACGTLIEQQQQGGGRCRRRWAPEQAEPPRARTPRCAAPVPHRGGDGGVLADVPARQKPARRQPRPRRAGHAAVTAPSRPVLYTLRTLDSIAFA